jgi:hypothetical protein
MGEKKRLRTVEWKRHQLLDSIGQLCKAKVKINAVRKKEKKDGTESPEASK